MLQYFKNAFNSNIVIMLNDSQADSSSEDKSCDESDPRASELNSQELQLLVSWKLILIMILCLISSIRTYHLTINPVYVVLQANHLSFAKLSLNVLIFISSLVLMINQSQLNISLDYLIVIPTDKLKLVTNSYHLAK